ncbi:hypothetical protein cyc_08105 [Cyclospora cayetanensis]|uniref:Uncharacterized protein n=1 Tax=Cyclospora cayetanensis TaxID=88456 RepID=A0A1D3CUI7_9EIME|nr:hypothetical protein cyc_08105 [Cyclospora cayetanensis]
MAASRDPKGRREVGEDMNGLYQECATCLLSVSSYTGYESEGTALAFFGTLQGHNTRKRRRRPKGGMSIASQS